MSQSKTKPQNNAEIVKAYFDAFAQNDPTVIERYFTPDVDYVVIVSQLPAEVTEALPWLGVFKGREGVKQFFSHLQSNIDVIEYSKQEVVDSGDSVAVFGTFNYRAKSTNQEFASDYAIHIKMRDGLISYYHFYENTYAVAAAFRQGSSWEIENDGRKRNVP